MNKHDFPIFRKYPDAQTFFMIEADDVFTELKRMGKYYSRRRYQAQNYADRLMIADMIALSQKQYFISTAEEFNNAAELWVDSLQPFNF